MSDARRALSFRSEDEAIAELDRLRVGGYAQHGSWSLQMICWHLAYGGELNPPASTTPTPEQAAQKKAFIDLILSTGKPPPGFQAPPEMTPSPDCDDAAVLGFRTLLKELKAYPHSHIDFGPFGPVSIEDVRKLTLLHAGHHLSFLEPKAAGTRRSGVQFANEDEVIADVRKLRRGYVQAGAWSLPQVCAHLDKAVQFRMQPGPFPPDSPEQAKNKPRIPGILAEGRLPEGIKAPEPMQPPADCSDEAIDSFIATMKKFKTFAGPIAPHRIFGHLKDADARRLNLIHCAHHLSYLTPTTS
ncbi:MAG: DUF1569 domain-containing protein [Tepidisphaeraceae bacterium]